MFSAKMKKRKKAKEKEESQRKGRVQSKQRTSEHNTMRVATSLPV